VLIFNIKRKNNMKRYNKLISITIIAFAVAMAMTSCSKQLDSKPIDPSTITSSTVYDNPANYKLVLAKLYAGLALSGQQGPSGNPDISGIDEGFSTYLRQLWCAEELPTDEAVIGWNDAGLKDYHNQNWSASNQFIAAMYNRIYYQVSLCNEYIRQVTPRLSGLSSDLKPDVTRYLAEARFLRAFSYYHALDMYGNVPFVTEADQVGSFFPKQTTRADLFNYVESELKAIEPDLAAPKTNEYGRVDQAAAWTLLAKLYLNAEVYLGSGQKKYTECLTYCNKVIATPYTLDPVYANMFLADNNKSPEIIFPVVFDGVHAQSWGGMTFIIHSEYGGSMDYASAGLDGGWGGMRATKAFVQKFPDPSGATDKRAMFYTKGQNLEIKDVSLFTDGYAITKFKNITSTGAKGSNLTYVDTDYPVFRLADVYLMYAEAVLRGGTGGDAATALTYVNDIRSRAYGNATGNITAGQLNLAFILDERSRELYWEGQRRTDLIRFNQLTTADYLWPWKGGIAAGQATDTKYNIFPIPSTDLGANPNLVQNTGY
jgi:hypothetical protein